MLRLLKLLPFLIFLIGADSWNTNSSGAGDFCPGVSYSPKTCYLNPTVSGSSTALHTGRCENFDVVFNSDTLTTDNDTTIIVYSCVDKNPAIESCEAINNNNLDGDPAVGGFEILGAAAIYIYVETILSAGDTPRVAVNCHPRT